CAGLGYASQLIILHGCVYYIVILAWAVFYLSYSFQAVLPWSHCNNTWNTEACVVFTHHNQTANGSSFPANATSPVMEFWEREVLKLSDNLDELGPISWKLALCLAIVWLVCYFCIWKGVKSTGKVVYLTATFPYVMLFVLLVRGATLPGATQGIIYYLKPNHTRLADPQVWMDAGTQIFFSYGICLGSLTALGSYNKYNNDCYKDSFLLCLLNSTTSFLAGFAIFSVLGFMAEEQGVDIATVAESGPGLAFIAYPRAVAMMPLPQLWAVCFFLMIIMLGLDTQFVSLEALMTSVTDLYPHLIRRGRHRELLLLFVCMVCFLVGLVMVTPEQSDSLCWKYLTPLVCTGTFVFSLVCWAPLRLSKDLVAPGWATALGWILALSSVSLLPIWAIYALATTPGTLAQRFHRLCSPSEPSSLGDHNSTLPYRSALPMTEKQKEPITNIIQDHM
ncbi:hypothetical protein LDENG_00055740, partial [Lucifuga dentata]